MALPDEIRKKTLAEIAKMESEGVSTKEIDAFLEAVKAKYDIAAPEGKESTEAIPEQEYGPRGRAMVRLSPESRQELSMLPPDVRAIIERTSSVTPEEAGETMKKAAPYAAGIAAQMIPIPGVGPTVGLLAQSALGGAAALGTKAALEKKIPSAGEAAETMAESVGPPGIMKGLGKLLSHLGEAGLVKAFKISKLMPKTQHTPPTEIVRELMEKHGGITGMRGAVERSMEESHAKFSAMYDDLMSGPEGKKVIPGGLIYKDAAKNLDEVTGYDPLTIDKAKDIIERTENSARAQKRISRFGTSNLKEAHNLKVGASRKADFGNPEKSAQELANSMIAKSAEKILKQESEPYKLLSEAARNEYYKFEPFVEKSGETAARNLTFGLPQQLSTIAAAIHPAAIVPGALSFIEKYPAYATQSMRAGDVLQNLARLRAIPGIMVGEAMEGGEPSEEEKRRKQAKMLGVR